MADIQLSLREINILDEMLDSDYPLTMAQYELINRIVALGLSDLRGQNHDRKTDEAVG